MGETSQEAWGPQDPWRHWNLFFFRPGLVLNILFMALLVMSIPFNDKLSKLMNTFLMPRRNLQVILVKNTQGFLHVFHRSDCKSSWILLLRFQVHQSWNLLLMQQWNGIFLKLIGRKLTFIPLRLHYIIRVFLLWYH